MDSNIKRKQSQNPRIKANIFEKLTYSWMINLFKVGRRKDLEHNDLYATLDDYTSSKLAVELEKKWSIELDNAHKSNRNPSLLKALLNMFGANYAVYGLLLCFDELVLKMSQPLFIGGLLKYFDPVTSKRSNVTHAWTCASGLVCSMLISIVLKRWVYNEILLCGMKMRVACSSILYRKALKLSRKSLGATTAGHVVNLLSNDLNRFDDELTYLQYLWIGPLQTIVITYFLWQEIGVSSLFGIAILLFVIPLQGWFGKKTFQFRMKAAKWTDERGRLLNEIIASIQVIKMYTWEKPFSKLIEYARKKEIGQIQKITFIHAISFLYRGILIRFQMFVCILAYVLLGNYISISKVFVVMLLYNLLHMPMAVFFCTGIIMLADLLATIKRIQNFFLFEEKESVVGRLSSLQTTQNVTKNGTEYNNKNLKKVAIDISNASASWEENQKSTTLNNITLKITQGQLAAIIGPVGAGKSSIIQLILQELPLSEGTVSVRGAISYASQEPWLFIGSVRQNILFDSPMNEERYKQVVKSCGLEHDFKQFPFGDKTIIGEKGVTLSGGQQSRISLARAIYREAEIYLLDDPLSAVDSRVGKHVYEKCIKGFLKGKTCIFTTHRIQLLRNEEFIVLMEKANILAQGSFQVIMTSDFGFEKLCGFSNQTVVESDIIGKLTLIDDVLMESSGDNNDENKEPNEVVETRSSGHISKGVYSSYISTFGSLFVIFFSLFMYIITQVLVCAVDFWTTFWVNQEDNLFQNSNSTTTSDHLIDTLTSNFRQTSIIVFIVLNILLIISISIRSFISTTVCTNVSLNLHSMMFNAILRAKMFFVHSNTSGRILNRFSNDIGTIDVHLSYMLIDITQMVFRILGSFFLLVMVEEYFLIPTIFLGFVLYLIRSFYLSTSWSIKRLEGVTRSPVLGHMNTSLQGLITIRAYEAEKSMYNEFDKHQDLHSSVWYLFICSKQAISLWLDFICLIYFSVIIFSFLLFSNNTNGAYVGLVITQMIGVIITLQFFVVQTIMIENQMISVERVLEYTKCPKEEDNQRLSEKKLPESWPDSGCIIFKNVSLRYSPNSPHVLKNLSFKISSTEKIGIVGRTGAGKSSIIQALFRLAFDEGEVFIDNIEIHDLGLNDLRSKISVIPQDPVLFSGTIRYNLDPFDEFPDHALWNALDEAQLKSFIENLIGGLSFKISQSGSNFSVGQKQLICLARALLHKNKILILDEATANIDEETDLLIQDTIRTNFQTSTVITVTHRLNTIMNSDRVLVMDFGSVIEFDHPHVLLEKKDGLFYSMVEQTGRASCALIHRVAAENFKLKQKKI